MKGQKHEKLLDFDNVIESLSPNERAIIPHLKEKSIEEIDKNTGLGKTSVLRALEFLSNKNIVKLSSEQEKILELGVNGILYLKNGLPERKLISIIGEKNSISLQDAKKLSGLNDNEFKAALGALKKKALINLINGNIILAGS
ncbi:MAG: hypothetical protein PHX96_07175, partial [Candidatus Nanoarchaeia archaeon]|nr:hypothetical protein [Candidatus Nanoarchaeia archaeon]